MFTETPPVHGAERALAGESALAARVRDLSAAVVVLACANVRLRIELDAWRRENRRAQATAPGGSQGTLPPSLLRDPGRLAHVRTMLREHSARKA